MKVSRGHHLVTSDETLTSLNPIENFLEFKQIAQPADPADNTLGRVWYDSTANRLHFIRRNDGDTAYEVIDLEGGGAGGQTPWNSNIDADNYNLFDIDNLQFFDHVTTPAGTIPYILFEATASDGFNYNVPTGNAHIFLFNGTGAITMNATVLDFPSTYSLQFQGSADKRIAHDDDGFTYETGLGDWHTFEIDSNEELLIKPTEIDFRSNDLTFVGNNVSFSDGHSISTDADTLTIDVSAVDPNDSQLFLSVNSADWIILDRFKLDMVSHDIVNLGGGTIALLTDLTAPNFATDQMMVYDADDATKVKRMDLLLTQSPWNTDINANNYAINNLDHLEFDDKVDTPVPTNAEIYYENTINEGFYYNVPTDRKHSFLFNGTNAVSISSTSLDLPTVFAITWASDANRRIYNDSTMMIFEVDTGDTMEWHIASTPKLTLSSTVLDVKDAIIDNIKTLEWDINTGTVTNDADTLTLDVQASVASDATFYIALNGLAQYSFNDAGITIGTSYLDVDDMTAPPNPLAGHRRIFVDTATGELSVRTNAGTTISLEGGLSEPLIQTVTAKGNVTGAVTIDADDGNIFTMTLTGNVTLTIDETLASGKYELIHIIITQNATGGYDVTFPADVNGTPFINKGANEKTDVVLYTVDQGVTWEYVIGAGVSGGGAGGQTPWTSNIDGAGYDLINVQDITARNGYFFTTTQDISGIVEIGNTHASSTGASALIDLKVNGGDYDARIGRAPDTAGIFYIDNLGGGGFYFQKDGENQMIIGDGSVSIEPQDGVNEGGQLSLIGASTNDDIFIDNEAGNLRLWGANANSHTLRIFNYGSGGRMDVTMMSGSRLYLDANDVGTPNNTFITEEIADNVMIYVEGNKGLQVTKGTTNPYSNVIAGRQIGALPTNTADGFLYISAMNGVPTGTPTSFTWSYPMVWDALNNNLMVFDGAWLNVGITDQVIDDLLSLTLSSPNDVNFNTGDTPSDNNELYTVNFQGKDLSANDHIYAQLLINTTEVFDGDENATMEWHLSGNGNIDEGVLFWGFPNGSARPTFSLTMQDSWMEMEFYKENATGSGAILDMSWWSDNSIGTKTEFARIEGEVVDYTNGSEDGRLRISVQANSTTQDMILIDGNWGIEIGNGSSTSTWDKIGFFGANPVAQPTGVSATSSAIITALQSLGLFG